MLKLNLFFFFLINMSFFTYLYFWPCWVPIAAGELSPL